MDYISFESFYKQFRHILLRFAFFFIFFAVWICLMLFFNNNIYNHADISVIASIENGDILVRSQSSIFSIGKQFHSIVHVLSLDRWINGISMSIFIWSFPKFDDLTLFFWSHSLKFVYSNTMIIMFRTVPLVENIWSCGMIITERERYENIKLKLDVSQMLYFDSNKHSFDRTSGWWGF